MGYLNLMLLANICICEEISEYRGVAWMQIKTIESLQISQTFPKASKVN